MSTLVVVAYPSLYKAEEVRLHLLKLQKEYLLELEDAAIAVKQENGKIKLHQLVNLTAGGAVSGGFWGALIGLIFLNPLLGAAVGAGAGAVSGALADVGVNDANWQPSFSPVIPRCSCCSAMPRWTRRWMNCAAPAEPCLKPLFPTRMRRNCVKFWPAGNSRHGKAPVMPGQTADKPGEVGEGAVRSVLRLKMISVVHTPGAFCY